MTIIFYNTATFFFFKKPSAAHPFITEGAQGTRLVLSQNGLSSWKPQLSHPFHIREVLQLSGQFCGPSLDLLQQVHVLCWRPLQRIMAPQAVVTPQSLVSSANLLLVHLIPLSVSLTKMLCNTGPSADRQGTPLVIPLHPDSQPLATTL